GSGGREHAIAWALGKSQSVSEVVVAPGNDGMTDVARVVGGASDVASLRALVHLERPDLVVIGPEAPLVEGLADLLRTDGFSVFGPGRAGARLEGSKSYSKAFMLRHGVPTAAFRAFTDLQAGLAYLDEVGAPVVVKDSNLAAGKGVTVADTLDAARAALTAIFEAPGAEAVVEERLVGDEISVLLFVTDDGYRLMPPSRDYKRVGDGDVGPMTGGMGTVAPLPLRPGEHERLVATVVAPVIAGIRAEELDYRGVLYIGVMRTPDGFKVLEFNVRFGDPEAQVLLPLLATDAGDVLAAVAEGQLAGTPIEWRSDSTACVVMAAPGYPGQPTKGVPITLPGALPDGSLLFHSGTAGRPLASAGGRVLNVVARAATLDAAVDQAYRVVDLIGFPGAVMRRDIGAGLDRATQRHGSHK
ncbi:MAG TPA: phosphoribosylamine--glycine ligase, partial [Trueperaceae bacterium]|nr:phosphoribosylamine--glycine ligase [Trueperaceae bacterium]